MSRYVILFFISINLASFSQEATCEKLLIIYDDLIETHNNSLQKYYEQIDLQINSNPDITIEKLTQNKSAFLGNYLNIFLNDGKHILNKFKSKVLKKQLNNCLLDEDFNYQVKQKLEDSKNDVKFNIPNDFHKGIDLIYEAVKKRITK